MNTNLRAYTSCSRFASCPLSRKAGFSLIEVLVVIGIIAFLIAILLPVVSRAQRQSRSRACQGQLHDIGSALQNYLNQNRQRYPPAPTLPGVPPEQHTSLVDFLSPY